MCLDAKLILPSSTREKINSFIIIGCKGFTVEQMMSIIFKETIDTSRITSKMAIKFNHLETIYGYNSSRNVRDDSSFLKQLFDSPHEAFRSNLWKAAWAVRSSNNGNENFVRNLFSICGTKLFAASLTFTFDELKKECISEGFLNLLDGLCDVLESVENVQSCLDLIELTHPFLAVFKTWILGGLETDQLFRITSVLLTLLSVQMEAYDEFQRDGTEQRFEIEIMKALITNHPQYPYDG
ncbi:unnamed protein product [Allacma fusca]|uniref:Uncharacterized protein n=1 Tax=Allacma fusca TaxID=39272 RepID=A0A8J2KAH4_9HEXA|nr:unnamed protein product [Allacma fusca]